MHYEPIIRPVRAKEASKVKRLIYSVAHSLMEPQMTLKEYMDQWEAIGAFSDLADIQKNYFDNGGVFLAIEINGRIVGTGAFHRYIEDQLFSDNGRLHSSDESLRTGKGLCELRRVTLLPKYRGQKLGYALMLDLIHRAKEMGYTKMILWTDPINLHRSVDFYHQLGFSDLPIEGIDADELWMGKEI